MGVSESQGTMLVAKLCTLVTEVLCLTVTVEGPASLLGTMMEENPHVNVSTHNTTHTQHTHTHGESQCKCFRLHCFITFLHTFLEAF